MTFRIVAGAALALALSTAAYAQSYNAPAGIPAVTAPGGLTGTAGPRNVDRYNQRYQQPAVVDGVYTTGNIRAYRNGR